MPRPNRSRRTAISADQLQGFKYFDRLRSLLERVHSDATARDKAGNRELFFDDFCCLLLLYFFNPVITSLRSLQQASDIDKVRKVLGVKRTSLGALHEASTVFDPALLRGIVQELASQAAAAGQTQSPSHLRKHDALAFQGLTAVDGTLLRALPRMAWAFWHRDNRAVKMHLHFDVSYGVPCDATITPGASSEIEQLGRTLQPNRFYVVDRGYIKFRLFRAILDAGSSFVARVKDNIAFELKEERAVSQEARDAGVTRDFIVRRIGTPHHPDEIKQTLRIVMVSAIHSDGSPYTVWLLTDRLDLDADLVALAYRYRWTVELFFRWFKCILGCRHLMFESANGVALQCYVALIASLMVVLWTGLHPTKRTWEMLQFFLIGWATLEELERHLAQRRAKETKSTTNLQAKA